MTGSVFYLHFLCDLILILIRSALVGHVSWLSVLSTHDFTELAYLAINPNIRVIAPWRIPKFYEQLQGRSALLSYAAAKGIPVTSTTAKPYSEFFLFDREIDHRQVLPVAIFQN